MHGSHKEILIACDLLCLCPLFHTTLSRFLCFADHSQIPSNVFTMIFFNKIWEAYGEKKTLFKRQRRVTQGKVSVPGLDTYIFLYGDSSLYGSGVHCKQQGPRASLLGLLPRCLVQSLLPPRKYGKGRIYVIDTATCSMKLAKFMSRSERPAHSWVLKVMWTLLYTLNHSGWWSSFSACRATLVMKPKALLKSLKWNCLKMASRPSSSFHPTALRFGSSWSRSSALSLCALPAMSRAGSRWRQRGRRRSGRQAAGHRGGGAEIRPQPGND